MKLTRRQLVPSAITATLVALLLFPTGRRILIEILPLGRKPDDILFWVALIALVAFVGTNYVTGRRRKARELKTRRQTRIEQLKTRIPILSDFIYEWVQGDGKPRSSELYKLNPCQQSEEAAEHALAIVLEVNKVFQPLTDTSVDDVPILEDDLERMYFSLAGYPAPSMTMVEVKARLETGTLEVPEQAVSLLRKTPRRNHDEWSLDEIQPTKGVFPPLKGALTYMLDAVEHYNSRES